MSPAPVPAPSSRSALARAWREEMPLDPGVVFLNPGTLGGTLRRALDEGERLRRAWVAEGAGGALDAPGADAYERMRRAADGVRRAFADWLGCGRRHVALTGNATDGVHHALASIDWRPGDRVISTDQEHEALSRALDRLAARRGVVVDRVPFPEGEEDGALARAVAARLTDRTRLVAFSHVSCRTGVTADAAGVARAVAGHGALVLVDGAHGAGTRWPLLAEGVDFYAFPGHKWLFGPVGTGVLWVSARALEETEPLLAGAPSAGEDGRDLDGMDGAWRYEAGTRDWAAVAALGTALAFRRRWREEEIVAHYLSLGEAFRRGLGGRWTVLGAGPLLLLAMAEEEAWSVARAAWRRRRMVVKATPLGIRVSLGPWWTEEEAEGAAAALAGAAAEA